MEVTPSLINFVFMFLSNAKTMSCVMSEWLLFNTNWAIFQLYHGENKLIFNEMMNMRGDEGDNESERYTSWFDRCGFPLSNPLLHNTTWARRDIRFLDTQTLKTWFGELDLPSLLGTLIKQVSLQAASYCCVRNASRNLVPKY